MTTMIRASTLTGYFQVAQRYHLNPLQLLQAAGINPTLVGNADQRILISAACQLLEHSAAAAECCTFGLEMAELRSRRDVGVVGLLLSHAKTPREAIRMAERYRHQLNDALELFVDQQGEWVVLREDFVTASALGATQAIELAIGVLARICRALLHPGWHPHTVCFTHAAPANTAGHRRFFGCPVSFGAEFNGIVCAAKDLDAPNPAANQELVRYAESLAIPVNRLDPQSIISEVRRTVYFLLPSGEVKIETVASNLHLSVRTLQRQLNHAGTEFARIVSDVRAELAVRYLVNSRFPLGRVSLLLGYARQASFTRWFSSRFAMTPSEWRRANSPMQNGKQPPRRWMGAHEG